MFGRTSKMTWRVETVVYVLMEHMTKFRTDVNVLKVMEEHVVIKVR